MSEKIKDAIACGTLPAKRDALLSELVEESGSFVPQEGAFWDFKRDWPFSYSDDYFATIARLICAFANTNGGIIVFGVHDETRTPGHNKVAPNVDRLVLALMARERGARSEIQKVKGRLEHVKREVEKKSQWYDRFARDRVIQSFERTSLALGAATKR